MKTNNRKHRVSNRGRHLILAGVAVVLLAGLMVVLEQHGVTNFFSRKNQAETQGNPQQINYNPPTKEEQQAGDEQKQSIVDNQNNPAPSTPSGIATVTITGAQFSNNVMDITASITNIYKDGTCTFRLENSGHVVTKSTTAYRDVGTTICTNPLIPGSEFTVKGDWVLTVQYASNDGITGQSGTKIVRVE